MAAWPAATVYQTSRLVIRCWEKTSRAPSEYPVHCTLKIKPCSLHRNSKVFSREISYKGALMKVQWLKKTQKICFLCLTPNKIQNVLRRFHIKGFRAVQTLNEIFFRQWLAIEPSNDWEHHCTRSLQFHSKCLIALPVAFKLVCNFLSLSYIGSVCTHYIMEQTIWVFSLMADHQPVLHLN